MGLRDFINVIRARAWIVFLAAAVLALTAVVVSFSVSKSYQGQATLLLTQQNAGTALLGSPQEYQTDMALQRDIQTQIDLMRSPLILKQVISALDLETTPAELLDRVSIRLDGQTNIVTIGVTDGSPARAAATANALAEAYVAWSLTHERASISAAVDDVQKRLSLAQQQIVEVQSEIASGDKSGSKQVQLQAANSLYATLAEQLEQLKINEQLSTGAGSLLMSATPDPVAVSPKPVRNGALGLAMGLILGLGIAFVAETLDNTIKSVEQAEEVYGAPVLCNIPAERRKKQSPVRLPLVENPGGAAAEAYRMLRNNLGFINFGHDIKTVLVTSAMPSEGKSTVAANLAIALSRAGKKVILVSCDFHRPGAAQLLGLERTIGLSDVLASTRDTQSVIEQPKGFEGLWVIPAGSMPPNPSELLGSSTMEKLIAGLRESSDWVILDSAPLLAVADAAAAARWVDGVLVVTKAGVSTRDAARRSREHLQNVGARILGVAVWGLEDAADRSGYSEYGASPTL